MQLVVMTGVCGYEHKLRMAGEDMADWEGLLCAVVNCIVCKLVIML
jgi:hypothetical protein